MDSIVKLLGLVKSVQAQLKLSSARPKGNVATVLDHIKENQRLYKTHVNLNEPQPFQSRSFPPSTTRRAVLKHQRIHKLYGWSTQQRIQHYIL